MNKDEKYVFQSGLLYHLSVMNFNKGWRQQFHIGALRNANSKAFVELGPDAGFDSIGSGQDAQQIARFFSELASVDKLAPSIIYNNNPADNYMFAAMIGNYQDESR